MFSARFLLLLYSSSSPHLSHTEENEYIQCVMTFKNRFVVYILLYNFVCDMRYFLWLWREKQKGRRKISIISEEIWFFHFIYFFHLFSLFCILVYLILFYSFFSFFSFFFSSKLFTFFFFLHNFIQSQSSFLKKREKKIQAQPLHVIEKKNRSSFFLLFFWVHKIKAWLLKLLNNASPWRHVTWNYSFYFFLYSFSIFFTVTRNKTQNKIINTPCMHALWVRRKLFFFSNHFFCIIFIISFFSIIKKMKNSRVYFVTFLLVVTRLTSLLKLIQVERIAWE